jgi:hypothetical protein
MAYSLQSIASIFEHNPLISSANLPFVFAVMHVTGNVGALLVDANKHLARYIRQALAIGTRQSANIRVESDLSYDASHNHFIVQLGLGGNFAVTMTTFSWPLSRMPFRDVNREVRST